MNWKKICSGNIRSGNREFNKRFQDETFVEEFRKDIKEFFSIITAMDQLGVFEYSTRSEQIAKFKELLNSKGYYLKDYTISTLLKIGKNSVRNQGKINKKVPVKPGRPLSDMDGILNEVEKIIKSLVERNIPPRLSVIANELIAEGYTFKYGTLRSRMLMDKRFEKVKIQNMEMGRAKKNIIKLDDFFKNIINLGKIPVQFVSNMDESGYNEWVDKIGGTAWVISGMSPVFGVKRSSNRMTLVNCINLDGTYMKPFYIIPRKTVDCDIYESCLCRDKIKIAYQDKGFINTGLFDTWFEDIYLKEIKERRIKYNYDGFSVLILDGCSSHFSIRVANLAMENNVLFCFLPAHTSHLVQPLDLGIFGIHKLELTRYVNDDSKTQQSNQLIKNYSSLQKVCTISNIVSAFAAAGICIKTEDNKNYLNISTKKCKDDCICEVIRSVKGSEEEEELPKRRLTISVEDF